MFEVAVILAFVAFVVVTLQTIFHLRYLKKRNRESESGLCMRCGTPLDDGEPSLVCTKCGEPILR